MHYFLFVVGALTIILSIGHYSQNNDPIILSSFLCAGVIILGIGEIIKLLKVTSKPKD